MTALVGGASLSIGAIALLIGFFSWRHARRQLGWEAVPGRVCIAEVAMVGTRYFRPRIEYTYEHGGRQFRGAKVRSLLVLANWRGPAERLLDKYPFGSPVTVFVNPEDPRDSVLERGGDAKFFPLMLVVSAIFLIVGFAFVSGPR